MNKLLAVEKKYSITGPGIQTSGGSESITQLEKIISTIIGVLTVIGVIYFVIQIILSGYALITSQGDPKQLDTAKKRLTNNIIGLALIVLAYGLGSLIAKLLGMDNIFSLSTIFSPIK